MTVSLNDLDQYSLARILTLSEQPPSVSARISKSCKNVMNTPAYITDMLNHIAQTEGCGDIDSLGKKLGIINFSSLSLSRKIHAIYDKYHQEAQYLKECTGNPTWLDIVKLPISEYKTHVIAHNRLQFWKKLPGGSSYLESEEMSNLTDIQKAERFPLWLREHPEVLNLRCLNLFQANLTELPPEIALFNRLEKLLLVSNNLTTFSDNLNLPFLKILSLINNQITSLPDDFNPPRLETLVLTQNLLRDLPETFNPPNLRCLNLDYNPITSLPRQFDPLPPDLKIVMPQNQQTECSVICNFINKSIAWLFHK